MTRDCVALLRQIDDFPKAIFKQKDELQRGGHNVLFSGTIGVFVWQDQKPIYFISTTHVFSPLEHVSMYSANDHRRISVRCPKVVKFYNAYTGGTDKTDQMIRLQKSRRHCKWPRRLMIKFFMWTAYNSYM